MSAPIGKCPLCLNVRTLRRSHCIPASIYRLLRANQSKHPNPVVFTNELAVVQSSRQWQEYLLCDECESRFSNGGEKYTITNCCRGYDGPFPLRTALEKAPNLIESDFTFCFTAGTSIDISAAAYFGLSIFWRAAVHEWNMGIERHSLPLSRRLRERLRRYLLGEPDLIPNIVLIIQVSSARPRPLLFACFPVVLSRESNLSSYCFFIPGIPFDLFVGDIPAETKMLCAVYGPQRILVLTTEGENHVKTALKRQLFSAASRLKFAARNE